MDARAGWATSAASVGSYVSVAACGESCRTSLNAPHTDTHEPSSLSRFWSLPLLLLLCCCCCCCWPLPCTAVAFVTVVQPVGRQCGVIGPRRAPTKPAVGAACCCAVSPACGTSAAAAAAAEAASTAYVHARCCAIDAGLTQCGYGLIQSINGRRALVHAAAAGWERGDA